MVSVASCLCLDCFELHSGLITSIDWGLVMLKIILSLDTSFEIICREFYSLSRLTLGFLLVVL